MQLCPIISKLLPRHSSPPLVLWSIKSHMQQLKTRHSSISLFPSRNQMIWCVPPPPASNHLPDRLLSHRSPYKRGTTSTVPHLTQNHTISPPPRLYTAPDEVCHLPTSPSVIGSILTPCRVPSPLVSTTSPAPACWASMSRASLRSHRCMVDPVDHYRWPGPQAHELSPCHYQYKNNSEILE
jgi:hypothetical protein